MHRVASLGAGVSRLHFARDFGLITDSSWFSIVDAGILEGIQNGLAALALGADGLLNPGSGLWYDFFDARRDGADDATSRTLWGRAEQASTDFGIDQAGLREVAIPVGGATFASPPTAAAPGACRASQRTGWRRPRTVTSWPWWDRTRTPPRPTATTGCGCSTSRP